MIKKEIYTITGIDQDTAPDKRGKDTAYDAENIRIINNGRNLSVQPLKEAGVFSSSFTTDEDILGSIEVDGNLYVFIHNTNTGSDTISKINSSGTRTDLLTGDFDFNPNNRIEAIANYENENIIKIYWTDGINQLRFINVANPSPAINLVEPVDLAQPTSSIVEGGNLINGNIQYVYNLYNTNGQETVLSPASRILSICKHMDGGISGESSGLSVYVTVVAGIDTDFEYIRLYSVHWQEENQTPTITLVADESIDGTTFSFTDDGNAFVSELSEAELFSVGSRPYVVGTLAAKRNRLFIANYSVTNFDVDVDMRAFAHSISSSNYRVDGVTRQLPTVPSATADCVNSDYDVYKYIASSTTYGVEGLNIRIIFNQSTPITAGVIPEKSMKQRETYRIGVKFFNETGQESPVKWIADMKVPTAASNDVITRLDTYLLNPSDLISAEVTAYQIVTVERKAWDRSIVSQGFLVPGVRYKDGSSNLLSPYIHPYYFAKDIVASASTMGLNIHEDFQASVDWRTQTSTNVAEKDDTVMFFYSTDTMFETELASVDNIRVLGTADLDYSEGLHRTKIVHYADGSSYNSATIQEGTTNYGAQIQGFSTVMGDSNFPDCIMSYSGHLYDAVIDTYGFHLQKYYNDFTFTTVSPLPEIALDTPSVFMQKAESKNISSAVTASNVVDITYLLLDPGIGSHTSYYCKFDSCVALTFSSATWHQESAVNWGKFASTQNTVRRLPIVELIRTLTNQYGGSTYEAKNRNTYLETGRYVAQITTGQQTHYVGDTYVGPLEINRLDGEDDRRDHYINNYEYLHIRNLEHNQNVYARHDNLYSWMTSNLNNGFDYQFFRIADNHLLTSGFNQQANLFVSQGKPVNFTDVETFANVVASSQEKYPNELIDSWTKFPVNENRALEGIYGKINKLYNFKGEILSFQDIAIAMLSINPRIQTQATDGVNIELGIGSVLYDHKYLTTQSGSINKFSVTDDSKKLYYYDSVYNTINVLADDKLSTLLGVRNILESNSGVISATYHRELDDIIFVLDTYSLVFNSLNSKFICKYTDETDFDKYPIIYGDRLLEKIEDGVLYERYTGTNYLSSSITYYFGPSPTFEKVFHNLEYRLFGQDFNQIQVTGNRNSSSLESVDVKVKFDNHRIHLPRYSGTRERFREHNILVKLLNVGGSESYYLDDMVIMYNIKG